MCNLTFAYKLLSESEGTENAGKERSFFRRIKDALWSEDETTTDKQSTA